MPFVNLNAQWFRCYSKAKLASDPNALSIYVKEALDAANEALIQPDLDDGERKAISVAIEDLHLMERQKWSTAAAPDPAILSVRSPN